MVLGIVSGICGSGAFLSAFDSLWTGGSECLCKYDAHTVPDYLAKINDMAVDIAFLQRANVPDGMRGKEQAYFFFVFEVPLLWCTAASGDCFPGISPADKKNAAGTPAAQECYVARGDSPKLTDSMDSETSGLVRVGNPILDELGRRGTKQHCFRREKGVPQWCYATLPFKVPAGSIRPRALVSGFIIIYKGSLGY